MTTIKCNYLKKLVSPLIYKNYITKKIDENNTEFRKNKVYASFIFISDIHWGANAKKRPFLIKQILTNTPLNKIIFGGDCITVSEKKKILL